MSDAPSIDEPWTLLPAQTSGTYELPASHIHIMPVDIPTGGYVQFLAYQSSTRQSSSPRLFISKLPYGAPLRWGRSDHISLTAQTLWFRLEDAANQLDLNTSSPMTWPVAPERHYICVRNMENLTNSWTIHFNQDLP